MVTTSAAPTRDLPALLESLANDLTLERAAAWRAKGGHTVGCAPSYVPTEIIDAAGALPVQLLGGGSSLEVVQGDAYFQSAICHLPRSLVELGLTKKLDPIELIVIPSTCDVLRNLTGTMHLLWPGRRVRYLELPQRFDEVGRRFYKHELLGLLKEVEAVTQKKVSDEALSKSIRVHNGRRRVLREIERLRTKEPWRVMTSELWLAIRAGAVVPPAEHLRLLEQFLAEAKASRRPVLDLARVVLTGGFCEQPPIGFLRTLERAGCAIIADDLLLGMRWFEEDVREDLPPIDALVDAYVTMSPLAPCRYEGEQRRPEALVERVKQRRAQGVIVASPSFCDPALLDRPGLLDALEKAGIPALPLQYAENSSDFGSVREQAGTFADALRLWEVA